MVIILDKPFSLGELAPQAFPHLYITTLSVNGPNQQVSVGYEYGIMSGAGAWQPTPVSTAANLSLMGADLIPFFYTQPETLSDSLWNQIERLIYAQIQQKDERAAGTIGEPIGAIVTPIDAPPLPLPPVDALPLKDTDLGQIVAPTSDPAVEVISGPTAMAGEGVPMPIAIPQADGGDA